MVQAGRLISKALDYEGEKEFDEAFDLFKAGVDVLLNGVQSEGIIEPGITLIKKKHIPFYFKRPVHTI